MNGAHNLAKLFGECDMTIGKLRIVSGSHARGLTLHIYVIADDKSKVEVFGIQGGHPGWTEFYGWLHKGKWQEDFAEIVKRQELLVAERRESIRLEAEQKRLAEQERVRRGLEQYK